MRVPRARSFVRSFVHPSRASRRPTHLRLVLERLLVRRHRANRRSTSSSRRHRRHSGRRCRRRRSSFTHPRSRRRRGRRCDHRCGHHRRLHRLCPRPRRASRRVVVSLVVSRRLSLVVSRRCVRLLNPKPSLHDVSLHRRKRVIVRLEGTRRWTTGDGGR